MQKLAIGDASTYITEALVASILVTTIEHFMTLYVAFVGSPRCDDRFILLVTKTGYSDRDAREILRICKNSNLNKKLPTVGRVQRLTMFELRNLMDSYLAINKDDSTFLTTLGMCNWSCEEANECLDKVKELLNAQPVNHGSQLSK